MNTGPLEDNTMRDTNGDPAADAKRLHQECLELALNLASRLDRLRESVAVLEAERNDYRRALYAWAKQQFSEEELQHQAEAAHEMMTEVLSKSAS